MFVCICNAIREVDLRRAATRCAGEADTVYRALGKAPQCCQCLDEADEILHDARSTAHSETAAATCCAGIELAA